MLFIALVKFKKTLSKEAAAQNLKDIAADTKGQVRYLGIYWTLGRYDTVVLFEAPNEKVAMKMALNGRTGWISRLSWPFQRKKGVQLDRPDLVVDTSNRNWRQRKASF